MGWPLSDTFTEASNTELRNHTSDSGDSWVEQNSGWGGGPADPVVVATGDYVHQTNAGSIRVDIMDTAAPSADYEAEADITVVLVTGADTGVGVRWTSSASGVRTGYIAALTASDANEINLQRWNAGAKDDTLGNYSIPGFTTTTYNLRLSVQDEGSDVRLIVYVDDSEVINYLDNSASKITAAGYAGIMLRGNDTQITLDNFEAREIGTDPLVLYTSPGLSVTNP
jgi:hypothetical protein